LSRYRLAHAQRLQGHYQQALKTLEPILTIDPSTTQPWYQMGVVYEGMGDQERAREHFQHFRKEMEAQWRKNPRDTDTVWSLAAVLSHLGQKELAMSWANKGL